MKNLLLDFLFPKKCIGCSKGGNYICDNCFTSISYSDNPRCAVCQKLSIDSLTHPNCKSPHAPEGILTALEYKGIIKRAIRQYKYKPYLRDLTDTLATLMHDSLIQQPAFANFVQNAVITSVPLSSRRQRERGYNQSELLAKKLAQLENTEYRNLLKRHKNTTPQYKLKRLDRIKNIQGVFSKAEESIPEKVIILDDITTTGATIRECTKVLKRNGAQKVLGVALAME